MADITYIVDQRPKYQNPDVPPREIFNHLDIQSRVSFYARRPEPAKVPHHNRTRKEYNPKSNQI